MDGGELARAFGEVVRAERTRRGFSQEGFADHVGVHRTYMGLVERGRNVVTILTARKIADGLDVPMSELFRLLERRMASGEEPPGGREPS